MKRAYLKHYGFAGLTILAFTLYFLVNEPQTAYAMHIMEGFLPVGWAVFWWVLFIPFFAFGLRSLIRMTKEAPELKLMIGLAGAFTFVLSALKIPSVTGSSSHPTGTGLGAVMFGPLAMSVLGGIVLLFQALLLAHGGLTTLGANAMSMAVAGPIVGYYVYKWLLYSTRKQLLAIFAAAALADLSTYMVTTLQLALAFPAENGGFWTSVAKFGSIFAVTQVPLAIIEGLLTVMIWKWLNAYNSKEIQFLQRHMKGLKQQ